MDKLFIFLLAGVIFLTAAVLPKITNPASNIWWGRAKIVETISPGQSKTAELVFTSKQDLGEVSLESSNDLSKFISKFEPATVDVVKNVPNKVNVTFTVPTETALDTYGGTIHVRRGHRTIGKALAVNLKVVVSETPPLPTPPSSWTTPVNISSSSLTSYKAKILPDSLGNLYAFWLDSDFSSYYKLMFSKWVNGSWETPTTVISADRYNPLASNFDFTIDKQNQLHAVYVQRVTSLGYVIYHTVFDGANWSSPQSVSQGTVPSIDIGPDNKAHIVYTKGEDIFYSSFDGANWALAVNLSNDDHLYTDETSGAKDIRVDDQGNIHVAWTKYGFGIMYTKFNGKSWSVPQLVSQLSSYPNNAYWLSLSGNGVIAVAYTRGPNNCVDQEIYFTFSIDDGVVWADPVQISASLGIGSRWPSLAISAPDNIQVVWGECQNGLPFRFFDGQNWSPIIDINSGTSRADFPNITVRGGKSYVVWGSGNDIYFSEGQ